MAEAKNKTFLPSKAMPMKKISKFILFDTQEIYTRNHNKPYNIHRKERNYKILILISVRINAYIIYICS